MEIIDKILKSENIPDETGCSKAVRLEWNNFRIESEPIARGASGEIYRAIWDGMVPVAIKKLLHAEHLERSERLAFGKEIETLRFVNFRFLRI